MKPQGLPSTKHPQPPSLSLQNSPYPDPRLNLPLSCAPDLASTGTAPTSGWTALPRRSLGPDVLEPVVGGRAEREPPGAHHRGHPRAARAGEQQRAEQQHVRGRHERQARIQQRERAPPQQVGVRATLGASMKSLYIGSPFLAE